MMSNAVLRSSNAAAATATATASRWLVPRWLVPRTTNAGWLVPRTASSRAYASSTTTIVESPRWLVPRIANKSMNNARWLVPRALTAPTASRWLVPRVATTQIRGYAASAGPKITTVTSPKIVKPLAPYSHAVKANGFVYVSGMIPMTQDGSKIEGDIKDNTRQVLENVKAVLEESGSSLEQVLKVNIYITDMAKFGEVNSVYAEYFNTHKPARTCVAVKELPMKFEVEMECVAVY